MGLLGYHVENFSFFVNTFGFLLFSIWYRFIEYECWNQERARFVDSKHKDMRSDENGSNGNSLPKPNPEAVNFGLDLPMRLHTFVEMVIETVRQQCLLDGCIAEQSCVCFMDEMVLDFFPLNFQRWRGRPNWSEKMRGKSFWEIFRISLNQLISISRFLYN